MITLLILFAAAVPTLVVGVVHAVRQHRVAADDADIEALCRGLQPPHTDPAVLLLARWSYDVRTDAS